MTNRSIDIQITLNGRATRLACSAPTQTLLHALNAAGHSGTKEGCGDGDCGACTVAILHADANGVTRAVAVNSCLLPAGQLSGANIVTVEGLKALNNGALHPSQTAMVRHGGSQCGYCTPGFVMSLFTAFHSAEKALDDAAVEGNLCRCTGYNSIRRAMAELIDTPAFALAELPAITDNESDPQANQWLYRPATLDAALRLKQRQPDAQWLAGATDLGLEFSRDALHPKPLIAIDALVELSQFTLTDGLLEIGAAVSLSSVQAALRGQLHLFDPQLHLDLSSYRTGALRGLYSMLHWFAATQVRNRATLGGNLGTASPIGDLLPVLLALDAEIVLQSVGAKRSVCVSNYFLDYRKTELLPDELVRCVHINLPTNSDSRTLTQSYKVGKRGSDDISIVAACFLLELDADNVIIKARLAYGGIAAIPIRASAAEALLVGRTLDWQSGGTELSALVRPALHAAFTPLSDFRGSADYRKMLIVNLFDKFLFEMTHASQSAHS